LNIGTALVADLIARARGMGYRRLVLDSHMSMTKAHEIYRAAGFQRVETPPDFPEDLKPVVVFMEMRLETAGRQGAES
jgi:ribosomal protein S18 acetylase RimI-like enzyme